MSAFPGPSLLLVVAAALGTMLFGEPSNVHYSTASAAPFERHVCSTTEPNSSNDLLGLLSIEADATRAVHIVVRSDGTFEPGLIVDADAGDAAELHWLRDIGGDNGVVDTVMVLPMRGPYTLAIVDRRAALPSKSHVSCADVRVTTERLPQALPLPPSWYGAVRAPVTFDVSRIKPRSHMVSVENLGEHGVLAVSVFEDGSLQDTAMIPPLERRQFAICPSDASSRVIIERGIGTSGEVITAFVTTTPFEHVLDSTAASVAPEALTRTLQ